MSRSAAFAKHADDLRPVRSIMWFDPNSGIFVSNGSSPTNVYLPSVFFCSKFPLFHIHRLYRKVITDKRGNRLTSLVSPLKTGP